MTAPAKQIDGVSAGGPNADNLTPSQPEPIILGYNNSNN
jgi:hypothetical protein